MKQNVINNIQISNITVQTFAVSRTYTPTTGMKSCIVSMVGGGGSAAYAQVPFTADEIAASQPVTVGPAGTGSSSALGSFGALMQGDSIKLVCTAANTGFQVVSGAIGNWAVT